MPLEGRERRAVQGGTNAATPMEGRERRFSAVRPQPSANNRILGATFPRDSAGTGDLKPWRDLLGAAQAQHLGFALLPLQQEHLFLIKECLQH